MEAMEPGGIASRRLDFLDRAPAARYGVARSFKVASSAWVGEKGGILVYGDVIVRALLEPGTSGVGVSDHRVNSPTRRA
jgi:hypothetical protein